MKRPLRRVLCATLFALLFAAGGGLLWKASLPLPIDEVLEWPTSPVLLDRRGEVFSVFLSPESEWSVPVSLEQMGRWLPFVAVEVEDRRFMEHGGIDYAALLRAIWQNVSAGKIISGASTITSQLVRLSFPRPRTLKTKLVEFTAAQKLEEILTKEEILELYLNRAPFGGNIRGVEAASRIYFSKGAGEVSLGEAALLVGMLKGPSLYRPDRNPGAARKRRDAILASLFERGKITEEQYRLSRAERIPDTRGAFPSKAFHFALAALGERKKGGILETTLDPALQELLERTLSVSLESLPEEITAAGIVMDNDSGDVLAYVGNGRLGRGIAGSWIDCARRPRSPGSALKPFAYLAAFEKGILTPASLLADTPLAFSGQAPRNFDLTYRGPVSARIALADSLNVPAVRVLRAAGPELVLDLLRNAGFLSLTQSTAHYGDSLILGGCETSVLQMAEGYVMLATLGIRRSPRFLLSEPPFHRRLVSEGAAFLVADILKDTGRLLPLHGKRIEYGKEWFAFKTGTSYGYRDAWTAAYTPRNTVVVWMGNPTGKAHPELVGSQAAAPAIVEILRGLPPSGWYDPPQQVIMRTVCALSGRPIAPACPVGRLDYALEGISSSVPCPMHVIRDGSARTVWPAELEEFALRRSLTLQAEQKATITSPLPGSRYILTPLGGDQRVALKAEGARQPVYWFVGGEYAGKQEGSAAIFWTLTKGVHTVSLVDAAGRTAVSRFTVDAPGVKGPDASGPPPLLLNPGD